MNHSVTIMFHYTDVLVCLAPTDLNPRLKFFPISEIFTKLFYQQPVDRVFASKSKFVAGGEKAFQNFTCGYNRLTISNFVTKFQITESS